MSNSRHPRKPSRRARLASSIRSRACSAAAGSHANANLDTPTTRPYTPSLLGFRHRSSAVEQGNHNPLVGGSNPSGATKSERARKLAEPSEISLDDVKKAARAIAGAVVRTPMRHSRTLSAIAGCEIFLKFENLQFT